MDISLGPGRAAVLLGQVVQGGGQLPGDRGVGQGRATGQAPGCLLPDMQMGPLASTLEQLRGRQL